MLIECMEIRAHNCEFPLQWEVSTPATSWPLPGRRMHKTLLRNPGPLVAVRVAVVTQLRKRAAET